jgi:hypothetical protein
MFDIIPLTTQLQEDVFPGRTMKNKVLMSVFFVLLLIAGGLPFWLDVSDYRGNNNFVYQMLFFSLLGGFWIFIFSYFVAELKKASDKLWRPVVVLVLTIGFFLHYSYGGLFSASGDGTLNLFRQPIMWWFAATAIGYLVLFKYNRNKLQPNQMS